MQAFDLNYRITEVAAPNFGLDVPQIGKIRRQAAQVGGEGVGGEEKVCFMATFALHRV